MRKTTPFNYRITIFFISNKMEKNQLMEMIIFLNYHIEN